MEFITPEEIYNDQPSKEYDEDNLTPMKLFYKGKTVFLTGGTGFLGQLYVEKLLRCDVKHIYLLGRAKKGKSAEERLKNTFSGKHFVKLYNHDKNFLKRLTIVEGDMGKTQMGISQSDNKDLIENVEIVIHAAADVRFNEKLHKVLLSNLRGTSEMLKLTSQMKNIQAFAFISTAYSNCVRTYVEEKFYDAAIDPDVMIKLAESYNDSPSEELEILTERIIKPWPNTYTYTKALTEEIVRRYSTKFPICIIRPTICIATHEDPIPAWSNNIYGFSGILVAIGIGFLRVIPLNKKFVGDIVCADFVINSTLAALWVTNVDNQNVVTKDPEIYHVCTSTDRPETFTQIVKSIAAATKMEPNHTGYWVPCYNTVSNGFWLTYCTIFYHVIPGLLTDAFLKISGKSLRVMPVYRKVQSFMVAMSYFMLVDWRFDNTNMKRVLKRMSAPDQEFFPSDVRRYKWSAYVRTYLNGMKVYIGNESMDLVEKAKRKRLILNILHLIVLAIYYGTYIWISKCVVDKLGLFEYIQNKYIDMRGFLKNPLMV